jgi:cytoskeletal protein CcmA (bactofilin family)
MAERHPLGQFRLRRLALQLRQFTVNELRAAGGVTAETVYGFVHDLKLHGDQFFTTQGLSSEGPGRPIVRYILTPEGVEFLASQNVALANELNEFAYREDSSLAPVSRKARKSLAPERLARRLAAGLQIKGEVTGIEDFQVEGSVDGFINLGQSKVIILASAKVTADVIAREVVIYGNVRGNVRVSDRIEIKKDASLCGDITTSRLTIEDGAFFRGTIEIDKSSGTETSDDAITRTAGVAGQVHKAAE